MGDRPLLVEVLGVPAGGRALAAWLAGVAPARARGSLTVAVTTDARVRALNRRFRGVSKPTDVLSFPADEPGELGDIVIARGVAVRQARDLGHSLSTELKVLALHGLLHLLGYDHERDGGRMARAEARLRRRGGLEAGLIERTGQSNTALARRSLARQSVAEPRQP
jgi:probable rRNA maturation factor